MSSFWARLLGCCNDEASNGQSGRLLTQEQREIMRKGIKKNNQKSEVKELSVETEGLIILLELYKLEMIPLVY